MSGALGWVIWLVAAACAFAIARAVLAKRRESGSQTDLLDQWDDLKTRHERLSREDREQEILGKISQHALTIEAGVASPAEVDDLIRRQSVLFDPEVGERWFRMSDEEIFALGRGLKQMQTQPDIALELQNDEDFLRAVRIAKGATLQR